MSKFQNFNILCESKWTASVVITIHINQKSSDESHGMIEKFIYLNGYQSI